MNLQVPQVDAEASTPSRIDNSSGFWKGLAFGASGGLVALVLAVFAIIGLKDSPGGQATINLPPELLQASASHGGTDFAVATGNVSDDVEGVFFLDFLTGELTCWVYYPRSQQFAAKFVTNVQAALPSAGQKPQYLMVTGTMINNRTTVGGRPGGCLVYVVEPSTGMFAAYGIPWNRSLEAGGAPQAGALIPAGGGLVSSRGALTRDNK